MVLYTILPCRGPVFRTLFDTAGAGGQTAGEQALLPRTGQQELIFNDEDMQV
jgi:hypothetical protein